MKESSRPAGNRAAQEPSGVGGLSTDILPNGTAYDRLLDQLDGVKRKGDKADARCPAHHDRTPSLSVTRSCDSVLVHCHAGCTIEAVCASLGITKADLYDHPKTTYIYEDGAKAVRYFDGNKKRFYQAGHDTNGGPTVLFQLGRVQAAVRMGAPVWMVEGEKDVFALETAGEQVTATTARGGVDSLHKCDVSPLHGAHVRVIVDKDKAGDRWAEQLRTMLDGKAASLTFYTAKEGKDAADHIAAGHGLDEFKPYVWPENREDEHSRGRTLVVTCAADIKPRRVKWLEPDRFAIGTLALLAGREGLGKSTFAYERVARITRGELDGEYKGTPKGVLICATEDAWEETIIPRLIVHSADLHKVFRVEVLVDDVHTGLSLPKDLHAVEQLVAEKDAVLLLLDPLTSRIDEKLDTHKDAETRRALEPVAALAMKAKLCVIGLIHHNKSGSTDPLQLVMGSKAFTAVARSVSTVVPHPEDPDLRLFGTPKNNLGRTDLPTLAFRIESAAVETEDGTAWVGRIKWQGQSDTSIDEAMKQARDAGEQHTATADAQQWLADYLQTCRGKADSAKIKAEGKKAGHNESALQRARQRLKLVHFSKGMPRRTWWALPGTPDEVAPEDIATPGDKGDVIGMSPVVLAPWGDEMSEMNETTGRVKRQSSQSSRSFQPPSEVQRLGSSTDSVKAPPPQSDESDEATSDTSDSESTYSNNFEDWFTYHCLGCETELAAADHLRRERGLCDTCWATEGHSQDGGVAPPATTPNPGRCSGSAATCPQPNCSVFNACIQAQMDRP